MGGGGIVEGNYKDDPLTKQNCSVSVRQRCQIIQGMRPLEHKDPLIDRSEDVFIEYSVLVISFSLCCAS